MHEYNSHIVYAPSLWSVSLMLSLMAFPMTYLYRIHTDWQPSVALTTTEVPGSNLGTTKIFYWYHGCYKCYAFLAAHLPFSTENTSLSISQFYLKLLNNALKYGLRTSPPLKFTGNHSPIIMKQWHERKIWQDKGIRRPEQAIIPRRRNQLRLKYRTRLRTMV